MAIKPTNTLVWATNVDSDKTEYTTEKKESGYTEGDYPDFNEFNHFRNTIHLWLLWLASIDLENNPLFRHINELELENIKLKNRLSSLEYRVSLLEV